MDILTHPGLQGVAYKNNQNFGSFGVICYWFWLRGVSVYETMDSLLRNEVQVLLILSILKQRGFFYEYFFYSNVFGINDEKCWHKILYYI